MVERWTISVPEDVAEQVAAELEYGDNRSEWIVTAIEQRLSAEAAKKEPADNSPTHKHAHDEIPQTVDEAAAAAAIGAAIEYIEQNGSATKQELVAELMPKHSLNYEVPDLESGRYRGSWWRRVIKPGLEQSDAVSAPKRGGSEWRYRG